MNSNIRIIMVTALGFYTAGYAMQVPTIREKYNALVKNSTTPVYADLSVIHKVWNDGVQTDIYKEELGGLRNLYQALLLGSRPYSRQMLDHFIALPALQLIAYMQKQYGDSDPLKFIHKKINNPWENPLLGQYRQINGKDIDITYYSFFNGLLDAIERIEGDLVHGQKLYAHELNFFTTAMWTL